MSNVLENKGQSTRAGALKLVIDYYSSNFSIDEVDFIFRLDMLSNNINLRVGSYNFNDTIEIDTNKKIKRHTFIHGVKYSNERGDTLLLLNTLYELICFKEVLKPFEMSLRFNKREKEFFIEELSKIQRRFNSKIIINEVAKAELYSR